ncbi:SIR2 family histone deacetylase [Aspergillus nomiae NRRL 13137]|uniref:NAD-dependent protein deacetylase n=1 Tax=Aspergillus nomiae NRRL (strain ATCC 15546 / NRRL 13137 / CBS 260.88 / M93) TaxID=1509407 RepID=A0A0L1JC70_ASPN3|nr:SIR2 family histone deacetylase [Aspergillus nomiae NRRL 13137]KNG88998.1 SIR2 family histone deacetylase [Aspergillus nomiae NRRL 13137]
MADHSNQPPTSQQYALDNIANLIRSEKIARIIVLAGAGISTAAGVPDFRSPGTGLYDKLAPLKLPYPEAIFHINYFRHTPEPFYALARARNPKNLKPTVSHAFLALLAKKNLLDFVFTQNIDGLEIDAGVPAEKVLSCHGNWKSQRCHKCKTPYPDGLMAEAIETGQVPYCQVPDCGGAVKPDVVFFGEPLPAAFEVEEKRVSDAELMLVMGTSLKVAPCSRLPRLVKEGTPRLLVNMTQVGDFGTRQSDVCILGSCDDGVRRLADSLGWREELESLWTHAVAGKQAEVNTDNVKTLDECIEELAERMKAAGKISDGHKRMLEKHLEEKFANLLPGSSII